MNVVALKNINFSYDNDLIHDASFSLKRDEIVSIGGNVGCGKSTFLKIAAGLLMPNSGSVLIDGEDVWSKDDAIRAKIHKKIAFYFQEGALIANMNIFDNLALRLRYNSSLSEKKINERIEPWLEKLDLTKYKTQLPASLTLDLKRRVSMIRALLSLKPIAYFWDDLENMEPIARNILKEEVLKAHDNGIPSVIIGTNSWTNELANKRYKIENENLVSC